jgi:hypothetical protein
MSGRRMRWDRLAKMRGRQTVDLKHDTDLRKHDRPARWLSVVEMRRGSARGNGTAWPRRERARRCEGPRR